MGIRKYVSLMRSGILDAMQFRLSMFVTILGNLLYLLVVYNLWRAIFDSISSKTVNGMTFEQTMIYVVFASALINLMEMWIVWRMGEDFRTGQIVIYLLKPMRMQSFKFFDGIGEVIVKFFTTFLPTAIVVFIVSHGAIKLGWNLLFFVISVMLSILINFYINFIVGTICMYTQSVWGINVMKQVLISLFSGAVVPIAFFPDAMKQIIMVLPFQAICNTPLTLLLQPELSVAEYANLFGMQLFWIAFLWLFCTLFFKVSVKKMMVNGG